MMGRRFRQKFEEQLAFLKNSSKLFDEGSEYEAIRLAVSLRVLLHNTERSTSLVNQVKLNDHRMLSSTRGHGNWKDFLAHEIALSSPTPVVLKPLLKNEFIPVPMNVWWNGETVFQHDGNSYTRSKIILSAANKDGGAHVDPRLEHYYEELCAGEWAIGITGNLTFDGPEPFQQGVTMFPKNAHLALIRQFTHEAISTIEHFKWLK